MNNKGKHTGSKIALWIVAGGLLLYTGYRSLHLVSSTLPADAWVLGFAALAALDGGIISWLYYFLNGAREGQRTIAVLMVIVDFVGVAAALLGDTFLVSGGNPDMVRNTSIWIVPIVIALNVLAVLAVHIVDPDNALKDAERSLNDELHRQVAQGVRDNAAQVAAGVVPAAIEAKQREMVAGFLSGIKDKSQNGSVGKPAVTLASESPVDLPTEASKAKNGKNPKV